MSKRRGDCITLTVIPDLRSVSDEEVIRNPGSVTSAMVTHVDKCKQSLDNLGHMHPKEALERIAFLLERDLADTYKVKAFRQAANALREIDDATLHELAESDKLKTIAGVGKSTEQVIKQAISGQIPEYLEKLEAAEPLIVTPEPNHLMRALRGDCHTHSLWSDGGSPIVEMARTARDLGHEYIVMTDHSPNLKVANGLSAERLLTQLEEISAINAELTDEAQTGAPPFQILTGIEVDIMEDGSLDQEPELLNRLDVVVASIHSKLRSDSQTMTARMLAAIENPRTNILGHCTGRKVVGRGRPPSEFDAEVIFRACVENDVALEINSRPERKDPPLELLRLAANIGCKFAINTDGHAPGQLSWQPIGTERATQCEITADRIVNTMNAHDLVKWAKSRL